MNNKLSSIINPVKDKQTVTPKGELTTKRINDLVIHKTPPLEDHRGELIEMYRSSGSAGLCISSCCKTGFYKRMDGAQETR